MRQIMGIPFKSRENQKTWTQVKSYCFAANANPAFWCDLREKNKRSLEWVLLENMLQVREEKFLKKICFFFYEKTFSSMIV